MAKVAKRSGYSYRVTDLNYPAISVSIPANAIGAKLGAGKSFEFGRSVSAGVVELKRYYRGVMRRCPDTKWVLGGYSQGALVVARAVESFDATKVVYIGLVADPWTNLPEGKGLLPKACFGRNLSSYRVYAPECRTHTGTLGARDPYVASGFSGKYGLWCNKNDYICGSSRLLFNNSGHTEYAEKNAFIWMASLVARRLPARSDDAMALASFVRSGADSDEDGGEGADEIDDLIEAHFSAEKYLVDESGRVILDASSSFSLGHEIVEYQWSVDGEYLSSGAEPAINYEASSSGDVAVSVRVLDEAGRTAEATARIVVRGDSATEWPTMSAPTSVVAEYANGEIAVSWEEDRPSSAEYLLLRLNDVDLDFVPAAQLGASIAGINRASEVTSLKAAWLSGNYEVGEWAEVEVAGLGEIGLEPVETSVALADTSLLALAIFAMAVILGKKYLPG